MQDTSPQVGSQSASKVNPTSTMVRYLLYLCFIVIGFVVLRHLGPILFPVVAAAGVAYLLDGAVDAWCRKGFGRVIVVSALLIGFLLLFGGGVLLAIPLISHEVVDFASQLPSMIKRLSLWADNNYGIEIPSTWRAYLESGQLESLAKSVAGPAATMTAAALGGLFSILGFVAELLLVPVFAFYFLLDWDHMVQRANLLVPPRYREIVSDIVLEIDAAVSSWVRGQLIVTTFLGILYALIFRVLGVPMGFTIGAIVGLLTIIPFLGTIVGAAITFAVILLDWQSTGLLLSVGVTFLVLHIFEAAVLTPKLVGKKVGLGELGALFAVLAGGKLLGFTGVLLAVPLAASIAVLIRRAVRYYEGSAFFKGPAEMVSDEGHA